MLLLFKSGWVHFLVGAVLLLGGIALIEHLQAKQFGATYSFLLRTDRLNEQLALWGGIGFLGGLGIYAGMTFLGALLFPMHFLRWWFSELNWVYGRMGFFRSLSLALMAGLLIEPLFRLGIQPVLMTEIERHQVLLILAAAIGLASWTPKTNLLGLVAVAEALWFGWLYLETRNPFVPVIAHGLAEFTLALGLWKLERLGLTHQPPPESRKLVPVRSRMEVG